VSLADPEYVRGQYETEHGLAARKSIYGETAGPDARQVLFDSVAEVDAADVLEVGCGEGELAERLVRELGVSLVALDQSVRMVELAQARGVEARVGDVQDLPFQDRSFDVVVAAWMLFHVPHLDRGSQRSRACSVPAADSSPRRTTATISRRCSRSSAPSGGTCRSRARTARSSSVGSSATSSGATRRAP
jgi:SAM-dependent methyltransferase